MRAALIRSRGQVTLLAGICLALFLPFLRVAVLLPTGYADAVARAAASRNYAPLLSWAAGHLPLVVIIAALQSLAYIVIIPLPAMLRRVVFGKEGGIAQWIGMAGIGLLSLFAVIDLVLVITYAQPFASATPAAQLDLGSRYRFSAITLALVHNLLSGLLVTIWLVVLNLPLARIGGFERWVGFVGIAGAALFGATALLAIFDPQQAQGAIVGTTTGWFGLWLILVGTLLVRRAPDLGNDTAPTFLPSVDSDHEVPTP